jgi:hypothetical protein
MNPEDSLWLPIIRRKLVHRLIKAYFSKITIIVLILTGALIYIFCAEVDKGDPFGDLETARQQRCLNNAKSVNSVISCVPPTPEVEEIHDPDNPDEPLLVREKKEKRVVGDVEYKCTTSEKKAARNAVEQVVFDPNAESLWPGGIVQGQSIPSGHLTPIGLPRKPGTIVFTNLHFTNSDPSVKVEKPSLSTVTNAIQNLLSEPAYNSAKFYYDVYTGESIFDISFKVGVNVNIGWTIFEVGATSEASVDNTTKINYAAIKFVQSYYTVNYETPLDPEGFFDDDITVDELKLYVTPNNPPAYVSSINYGRMIIITFASFYNKAVLRTALTRYVDVIIGRAELTTYVEFTNILEGSNITIFATGGSAANAISLISTNNVSNVIDMDSYILEGATFSSQSPGVPVSYQLRWLYNFEPARLGLTSDYAVRTCEPVDPTNLSEEWESVPDYARPKNARHNFALAKNGEFLYALGGKNGANQPMKSVEYVPLSADGSVRIWKDSEWIDPSEVNIEMPQALYGLGAAVFSGRILDVDNNYEKWTRLYITGGHNGTAPISNVYYACLSPTEGYIIDCTTGDISANSWTEVNSLPKALYNHRTFSYRGNLYVVGGIKADSYRSAKIYYSKINETDGTLGVWKSTSGLDIPRDSMGVVAYKDYLYVIGGKASSGKLSDIQWSKFNDDGTLSSWHKSTFKIFDADNNVLPMNHIEALAFNNKLFILGGHGNGNAQDLVLYSTISDSSGTPGQWFPAKNLLPGGRYGHRLTQYQDNIYILGGSRDDGIIPKNNSYIMIQSKLRVIE